MRTSTILMLVLASLAAFAHTAEAQIPNVISYQGVLTDAASAPVADGSYRLAFKLYDSPTEPTARWSESQDVVVSQGIFNVQIGAVNVLTLPFDRGYFLGIAVDGGTELLPRTELTSAPYAFVAKRALTAAGLEPGASGVVTSVNTLSGAITLEGGGGTTISRSGNKILISSTGGSGGTGIQSVQNTDGTLTVQNPTGPVATLGLADDGINSLKLQDGSITEPKLAPGSVTAAKIGFNEVLKSLEVNGTRFYDDVVFTAGSNITLNRSGNTVIISATGGSGGSGIQGLQNTNSTLDIINDTGPVTTINIAANAIREAHLADDAVTSAKIDGSTASNGQVLTSDGRNSYWGSITPGVTGSGTTGQLAVWDGSSGLTGNAALLFSGGMLGVGVGSPSASLHVSGVDGLLAQGTLNSGTAVSLGAGTRMHWYPKKAAFRAGEIAGTQWDDANIGVNSVAMGKGTEASGLGSTAFGSNSTATGDYSSALGSGTVASGRTSIAMGGGMTASNTGSVAIGSYGKASGKYSLAMGLFATASGEGSTAIGGNVTAAGYKSTVMGNWASTTSNASGSFVIGDNSTSSIVSSSNGDRFTARFHNGYYLYTNSNLSTGVRMHNGANSWSTISDSTKKERFLRTDGEMVLTRFAALRLGSWNYKAQSPADFRHYGPMAQEWFAAFGNDGIGIIGNDTTIATADVSGILCIAVQALEKRTVALREKAARITALETRVAELETELRSLASMKQEMEAIKAQLRKSESVVTPHRASLLRATE